MRNDMIFSAREVTQNAAAGNILPALQIAILIPGTETKVTLREIHLSYEVYDELPSAVTYQAVTGMVIIDTPGMTGANSLQPNTINDLYLPYGSEPLQGLEFGYTLDNTRELRVGFAPYQNSLGGFIVPTLTTTDLLTLRITIGYTLGSEEGRQPSLDLGMPKGTQPTESIVRRELIRPQLPGSKGRFRSGARR